MLRPRSDVNFLIKFNDVLIKIFSRIHSIVDSILPASTHPGLDARKDALLSDGWIRHQQLNVLEQYFLDEGIKDVLIKALVPFTRKVDSIIGKKLNIIFPVK